MKLLLIEDEKQMAEIATRLLEPFCSHIDVAEDMHEAEEFIKLHEYDAIILDLRLPDSTYEQSVGAIRKLKEAAKAPIVVVTGMLTPNIKERCLVAGADAFVPKIDGFNTAMLAALHASILHNPKQTRSQSFFAHVQALERLVNSHAA